MSQKKVTVVGKFSRIVDERILDTSTAFNYASEKRAQGYRVIVENC